MAQQQDQSFGALLAKLNQHIGQSHVDLLEKLDRHLEKDEIIPQNYGTDHSSQTRDYDQENGGVSKRRKDLSSQVQKLYHPQRKDKKTTVDCQNDGNDIAFLRHN